MRKAKWKHVGTVTVFVSITVLTDAIAQPVSLTCERVYRPSPMFDCASTHQPPPAAPAAPSASPTPAPPATPCPMPSGVPGQVVVTPDDPTGNLVAPPPNDNTIRGSVVYGHIQGKNRSRFGTSTLWTIGANPDFLESTYHIPDLTRLTYVPYSGEVSKSVQVLIVRKDLFGNVSWRTPISSSDIVHRSEFAFGLQPNQSLSLTTSAPYFPTDSGARWSVVVKQDGTRENGQFWEQITTVCRLPVPVFRDLAPPVVPIR
jgi:hypothetical protein